MQISTNAVIACIAILFAASCGEAAGASLLGSAAPTGPSTFNPANPNDPNDPRAQDPTAENGEAGEGQSCQAHSQCPAGQACVDQGCTSVDYAFVTLTWEGNESQPVNLDLHVVDPAGNHIYWRSTQGESRLGSFAPHPECRSFDCQGDEQAPSESIYWPIRQMPEGEYQVWVENASESGKSYSVDIQAGDSPTRLENTLGGGERSSTFTFRIGAEEEGEGPSGPCYDQLRSRGVQFRPTTISQNSICTVDEAVMIETPIAGVTHRYVASTSTTRLRTSCEMALKLVDLSELLASRGVDTVYHGGSYECRNISGTGTPSQHSMARAYDIHGYSSGGVRYNYEGQWEHNNSNPTTAAGRFLYETTHAINDARIFNTILSPDYNGDHDNHIHVDFTGSSQLLAQQWPTHEMDPEDHDHACPNDL